MLSTRWLQDCWKCTNNINLLGFPSFWNVSYIQISWHVLILYISLPFPWNSHFLSPVTLSFLIYASKMQGSVSPFRYAFMLNYGRDLLQQQQLFDSITQPAIFYKILSVLGFQTTHRSLQTGMWTFKTSSPANKKNFAALYVKFSLKSIWFIQNRQLMTLTFPCRCKCVTFWYFIWVKIHGTN